MSESAGGSVALKLVSALPWRSWARPSIWRARMLLRPAVLAAPAGRTNRASSASVELAPAAGDVVAPGQLCNDLLHNCAVRPRRGKGAHVLEVARREPLHVGVGLAQVGGEPVDDLGAPAGALLALEDHPADVPVEQHHRRVRRHDDAQPLLLDALLDLAERLGVVARQPGARGGTGKRGPLARLPTRGARRNRRPHRVSRGLLPACQIDGTGAPPRGPMDVVVENNRITDVSSVGFPEVPSTRAPPRPRARRKSTAPACT